MRSDRRNHLVNKVQREQTSFFGTTRISSSNPVVCLVGAEGTADDCWEEFVKYTVEFDSLAMISIPSFVKICSGIQKLIVGDSRI
jgi:hypothetical protein